MNTTRSIRCGEQEIIFTVKRSRRRRTVALRVEPSGAVTVYAPHFVWGPFIDRFVQKQREWIFRKLELFKGWVPPTPLTPEHQAELRQITEKRLSAGVPNLARLLGVVPRSVKVAHQTRRWGSCSLRGHLRFSSRMAALPDPLFDYVVVHELAHLKQMNHSPRFWAVVESILPDFKSRRTALRKSSWTHQ